MKSYLPYWLIGGLTYAAVILLLQRFSPNQDVVQVVNMFIIGLALALIVSEFYRIAVERTLTEMAVRKIVAKVDLDG